MDAEGRPYRLFFYTSPYLRSKQVGGWVGLEWVGECGGRGGVSGAVVYSF